MTTQRNVLMMMMRLLGMSSLAVPVHAQTLTFTAKTTTGSGSVVPEFVWSTAPAAASCVASGDAAWNGAKAVAGNATLAAITTSKTYTLSCLWPGGSSAKLSWIPPTTNTDGSPLTDLSGYRVSYGESASAMTQAVQIPNSALTTYTISGLSAKTWFFGMKAYNAGGVESDLSNIVSNVISSTQGVNRTVGITVNPKPSSFSVTVE